MRSPELPAWSPRPDWFDGAACSGLTDLFFPEEGFPATARAAKKVCAGCPVRVDCLEYALVSGVRHGVWGGLAVKELADLRRARRRVA